MQKCSWKCLPLRYETTQGQWWYAAPIEWAAANGHYDLLRQLLLLDGNHLIKLTSLRRLRRLETLWEEDDNKHAGPSSSSSDLSRDVATCRALVARELLEECDSRRQGRVNGPLVRAGYGGWLIYTAAAAGDSGFVQELIERDPLIGFGEGEYGVSDVLYAAAKGKDRSVFRLVFDSVSSPGFLAGKDGDLEELKGEIPSQYKWEMVNRAVHAAARAGNVRILKELAEHCSDLSAYRDANGSTVLHSAAAKGQVEVVKYLLGGCSLADCTDRQGNTALHIAAYRGRLPSLRALISASPSLISAINTAGETFLHMAVAGFQSPDFQRLDRQIELVNHLILEESFGVDKLINARSSNGRTALHLATIGKVNSALIDLLMTVPSINLNIQDDYGMTPLDLLKRQPPSAQIDVLVRKLVSAGGEYGADGHRDSSAAAAASAARSLVAQLRTMQGYGISSPGTMFGIPDGEILLHAGPRNGLVESSSVCESNTKMSLSSLESAATGSCSSSLRSASSPARRLKKALWPSARERKAGLAV